MQAASLAALAIAALCLAFLNFAVALVTFSAAASAAWAAGAHEGLTCGVPGPPGVPGVLLTATVNDRSAEVGRCCRRRRLLGTSPCVSPFASPLNVLGEVQSVNAAPSRLHCSRCGCGNKAGESNGRGHGCHPQAAAGPSAQDGGSLLGRRSGVRRCLSLIVAKGRGYAAAER